MESSKLLSGVFATVGCAILMWTLYMILFGFGKWEGALMYASRNIEHPISDYYYSYCYLPNVHKEDDIDESLGGILSRNYSNMDMTESDLSAPNSDNVTFVDNDTIYHHYSSGWQ